MAAKQKSKSAQFFTNDDRTVLVEIWPDGEMTVATREKDWHTWGPPVTVRNVDEVSGA